MLGNKLSGVGAMLAENFRRQQAHAKGEGLSVARMVKNAKDIDEIASKLEGGIAASTGQGVRMLDGKRMVFFSDGSLRHALGRATTKAARKALKKARRAKNTPR